MSARKFSLLPISAQSPPVSPTGTQDPSDSRRLFRPYASLDHHVTKGRYITSNDPRGYIPVYEYPLHGQWIMMDMDDGYVLWTGIWKALGNSKADIVKMVESEPDLASRIRRVRGGYLKIQGTWMPYEVALRLSRRVAWHIRHDLVPLFGPTFPSTCLSPDQPGFGQIISGETRRRRTRRPHIPARTTMSNNWIVSHSAPTEASLPSSSYVHSGAAHRNKKDAEMVTQISRHDSDDHDVSGPSRSLMHEKTAFRKLGHSPYQQPRAKFFPSIVYGPHHYVESGTKREAVESSVLTEGTSLMLPAFRQRSSRPHISLPSISDLVGLTETNCRDAATTVLERLKSDQSHIPRRQSYPDEKVVQRDKFSSALSPFCPLPEQMRSNARPAENTVLVSVPINNFRNRTSVSSPTFSGSTTSGRDVSPTTPDSTIEHDGRFHVPRSPLIGNFDQLSPGQSHCSGRTLFAGASGGSVDALSNSPHRKGSVPIPLRDSIPAYFATSDGRSTPHLHPYHNQSVPATSASRPSRPW